MKIRKTRHSVIRVTPVRIAPVATAIVLASITGISFAADESDAESNNSALTGTEEIVVTATRRDTTVQEVPYNLSAISGSDIEALQIQDLSDIARWTPGLVQIDQGARNANQLVMRGINASAIAAPELLINTQGDRVSTYYGEVPVYVDLRPIDLDRVEVLRGPQGTLFGTRSLGGTLRYIPNQPDASEFTLDLFGRTYGMSESDDRGYDGNVVINVPLIQDTLALRALLGYLYDPGFIDQNYLVNEAGVSCPEPFFSDPGCTADDLHSKKDTNDEKTTSARLSLLWNITDSLDAVVSWHHQNQEVGSRQINTVDSMAFIDSDPAPGVQPLETGNYESGMRFLEPNDRENNIYNLTFTYDANNMQLVSTTSYSTYESKGSRDQTDLYLLFGDGFFPFMSAFTDDRIDDNFLTQELRLVSNNPDSHWDWIVGGFYQKADLFNSSTEYVPNVYSPFGYYAEVNRDTTEIAVFGEVGYQLTDKLHILGGGRYFDVDDEVDDCTQLDFEPEPFCDTGGGSDSDTLFKLSADYAFTGDLLGYALFSQGVSLGGVNPGPNIPPNDRVIRPESVDNYEVGLRSSWFNNALIVNGTLFYMDWSDMHLEATTPPPYFDAITKNGGSAESTGVEIEARAAIGKHWSLGLGYAYTDAELSDSCVNIADWDDPALACPIYAVETEKGDRLPGTPVHQGNFLVGYDTSLQNGLGLHATYRLTTQSDVFTKLGVGDDCCRDFGEALAGFTIHSATFGLSGESWEATLFADNLLNKYAETGVRNDTSFLGYDGSINNFTLRRYFKNVITPRTVGIDFRYHFRGN